MGITPIKDASGLQDMLIPQIAPAKGSDNSGNDFKSVWNSQASDAKSGDKDLLNTLGNDSENSRLQSKTSDAGAKKSDIRQDKSDNAGSAAKNDKPESVSKTDVTGKGSPEKTRDVSNENKSDGVLKDEEIVSATEVLSSQIASLVNALAEMLDISTEEVNEMLASEGIEGLDILDKDIFSAFMLKALGADSQLSLLTNEEDYAVYSEGMDLFSAVLDQDAGDFGITVSQLLDKVKEALPDGKISDITTDVALDKGGDDIFALDKDISDRRVSDEPVTRFVRNSEGDLEKVDIDAEGTVSSGAKAVVRSQESEKQGTDNGAKQEDRDTAHVLSEHLNDQPEVRTEDAEPSARPVFSTNAQEIADQIMDRMKTVTNGDFSDVEMQLHPASLGNLQIRVTNNAGVITATFVTENEAVKSAVESQMARLSDQLEAQGVRVEAVEVTIAPRGFDTGSNQRGNEAGEGKKGQRTRRINLGEDGELDPSDLEEEERIAAEMMAANGNSVDFMA